MLIVCIACIYILLYITTICVFYSINGSVNNSYDEESGFEESHEGGGDIAVAVTKFISQFVDRVCTESSIINEHTKQLLNKIPSLVHMQVITHQ